MLIKMLIRNYLYFANRRMPVKPYPLSFWEKKKAFWRRFSKEENTLSPSYHWLKTPGASIPVPELKGLYDGVILGHWTMDAASMAQLWNRLVQERPKVIVECGCGVSTVMFAKYFSLHRPDGILLSLEQDSKEKARLEGRLKELGLEKGIHIYHLPVSGPGEGYDFRQFGGLAALPFMEPFDWLIVDGPAGGDESRYNTVPSLQSMARPGATFFLDDSLRDAEMSILERWNNLPGIKVEGIYPIGKGLAVGFYK
ncbi:class I SAM-dependent methyltransferase [Chitinophaga qingshengii]|uniref:Class I SAM-dependent methyltransferase n=1 Tax=Chitinophaga qingshengii TaxID=1569794 RepID=A0ABR7TVA2_9BACT|nr:class I SAM-dependent methyltransferase [Chitinophaga qingshengii]MBC9934388.1 class I SAM-dependent methyltransferase [Chitinophaga qingshengii]